MSILIKAEKWSSDAIKIKFIKKISHECIPSILLCFMQDSSYESFFISLVNLYWNLWSLKKPTDKEAMGYYSENLRDQSNQELILAYNPQQ